MLLVEFITLSLFGFVRACLVPQAQTPPGNKGGRNAVLLCYGGVRYTGLAIVKQAGRGSVR